jgi:hypothetical protein
MNLKTTIALSQSARKKGITEGGGQTDSASFVGKRYRTVDTHYGHYIGEYDNPEEAEHAARARPFTKVLSYPVPAQMPKVRNTARRKALKKNPDTDN